MTFRPYVARARGWLLFCFVVSACGMVITALAALPWLAWATIAVSAAVTVVAWLSLGEETGILRTEKSLLVEGPLSGPISGPASAPDSAPLIAAQAEMATPRPVSDLKALIDSSVRELPESGGAGVAGGSGGDEVVSSARRDGAKTLRVAKSFHPPSIDEPMTVPETLDSEIYELVEKLGAGSMGEIWRGRHRRLDRDCAVKMLRKKAADWEDEQRFEREARVMAGLSSPHTVAIYDFGLRQDGSFYYVMELLDGIDLQKLVSRFGPLPARRVVHIMRQACHSLAEAHAAGLVHRDLKPANLILCRYGQDLDMLKLVDFGLAKEASPSAGRVKKLTRMRTVLGTAAYLAPESRAGSVHVDSRADLYGLACIAFWLLSGRMVFDEKNPIRMVQAHVSAVPPRVTEFAADVPPELDAIIDKCLAKKPEDRIQDARSLRKALETVCGDQGWTDEDAREWWKSHGDTI